VSKSRKPSRNQKEVFVNDRIRANKIRVITETGENIGEMSKKEAMARAEEASLDLVQISESGDVVTAKIMDFGKFLYTKKKQQVESKKNQKIIQIKEVKIRPNIEDQDYMTKMNHAFQFIKEGKRVKFTLRFRGRERATMNETGKKFFERIRNDLVTQDLGVLIEEPDQRGGPFWSKIIYIKEK
jgi:translation initiation factor IF-3